MIISASSFSIRTAWIGLKKKMAWPGPGPGKFTTRSSISVSGAELKPWLSMCSSRNPQSTGWTTIGYLPPRFMISKPLLDPSPSARRRAVNSDGLLLLRSRYSRFWVSIHGCWLRALVTLPSPGAPFPSRRYQPAPVSWAMSTSIRTGITSTDGRRSSMSLTAGCCHRLPWDAISPRNRAPL